MIKKNTITSGKYKGGIVYGSVVAFGKEKIKINNKTVSSIEVLDKNSDISSSFTKMLTGIGMTRVVNEYMINIRWADGQVSNATVDSQVFNYINAAAVSNPNETIKQSKKGCLSCSGMIGAFGFLVLLIFIIIMLSKCGK